MANAEEFKAQFIAERRDFMQEFHELVGTRKAIEELVPNELSERISYVEGIYPYLVRHGLNGGDNSKGLDEARDFVWVSGYSLEFPEISYSKPRARILFAGLTEYVGADYFGGTPHFRPGMRLGAAFIEKGSGYKQDDLAIAAKVIDDKHCANVGRFPLYEFSMGQLEDEAFISSSKAKLESQLGFLAEELKADIPSKSLV